MDGTATNSIKKIVDLYDEDFHLYKDYKKVHWTDINSWDFKELKLINANIVEDYFCDFRFFQNLELMPWVDKVLNRLKDKYEITMCSIGRPINLKYKKEWLEKYLPFVKFKGVNMDVFDDKSCVDMSGVIFIDDSEKNLMNSNAAEKICFGDIYPWNENWIGKRCANWLDVEKLLMEE